MPILTISQQRSRLMPPIPHLIFINGQFVGQMPNDEVRIEMPAGTYDVRIQSMLRWFSASQRVQVEGGVANVLTFSDRERWWDALFAIDIALEIVSYFIALPHPWNIVYKIFTWGYFIAWIAYEWAIRHHYFRTTFFHTPLPQQ